MTRKSVIRKLMQAGLLLGAPSIAFSVHTQLWFTDQTLTTVWAVVSVAPTMLPTSVPASIGAVLYAVDIGGRTVMTCAERAVVGARDDELMPPSAPYCENDERILLPMELG